MNGKQDFFMENFHKKCTIELQNEFSIKLLMHKMSESLEFFALNIIKKKVKTIEQAKHLPLI
jgi:hypothetical protein